jgi:hypothetical protein
MLQLNALAERVWEKLAARYPDWERYAVSWGEGDLEVAVPAPAGSNAGHLVVFTDQGERVWVRFSPASMSYRVEGDDEMVSVIAELMSERAVFVTTWRGDRWTGTALVRAEQEPALAAGESARIVSWTGGLDRVVPASS